MFQMLTKLSYDRSPAQAACFYAAYTLALIAIFYVVSFIGVITFWQLTGSFEHFRTSTPAVTIGKVVLVAISLLATLAILKAKGMLNVRDAGLWLLLALVLSIFGYLGVFLTVAYLTTRKHR